MAVWFHVRIRDTWQASEPDRAFLFVGAWALDMRTDLPKPFQMEMFARRAKSVIDYGRDEDGGRKGWPAPGLPFSGICSLTVEAVSMQPIIRRIQATA